MFNVLPNRRGLVNKETLGRSFQQFFDKQGFVYIVVVDAGIPVIRYADRQWFFYRATGEDGAV